jgi:hypothetical protein
MQCPSGAIFVSGYCNVLSGSLAMASLWPVDAADAAAARAFACLGTSSSANKVWATICCCASAGGGGGLD